MSSHASVIDQIGQFLGGGAYDANLHTYHAAPVTGISVVRRSWPKRDDYNEYIFGQPPGTMTGCVVVIQIPGSHDRRDALPAVVGRRLVHYGVELHCFVWSKASYAEDCQDFVYALADAIKAKVRTDPTLGSGGFENGAFMAAEGPEGDLVVEIQQGGMKQEGIKAYMRITFTATAYETG